MPQKAAEICRGIATIRMNYEYIIDIDRCGCQQQTDLFILHFMEQA